MRNAGRKNKSILSSKDGVLIKNNCLKLLKLDILISVLVKIYIVQILKKIHIKMYSAGDSSGDGLSGLNQFAGMSGSIDWAAMAQQWIQMHDTSNFMSMPDAPPPPTISNTFNDVNMTATTTTTAIKKSFDEKGEADMDMDEDEESAKCSDTPHSPAPSMQLGKNRDHTVMQPQSPWFMQQPNIVVGPTVAENIPGIGNTTPIIPSAPQWNATVWPPRINLPPPVPPNMLNVPLNSSMPNPTAHIPSLLKMNVPNPNNIRMISANTGEQNSTQSVVDAKKRKMLPAWIREGLEKMEREKQKQFEREQNKKHEEPDGIDDTKYTEFVGTTDDATHTVNMKYKQPAVSSKTFFSNLKAEVLLPASSYDTFHLKLSKYEDFRENDER